MKKMISASVRYVETDPRNLISEEDITEFIEGSILNLVEDYGLTVEECEESTIDWFKSLTKIAANNVKHGRVKSVYDR